MEHKLIPNRNSHQNFKVKNIWHYINQGQTSDRTIKVIILTSEKYNNKTDIIND